jgi:predicted nucleotidyltransferase
MYKRLNITLADEVLARADEFAARERYSRSALIAAALEAFIGGEGVPSGGEVAMETAAVYAAQAVGLNPTIRPLVPDIIDACRRRGAVYAALVGSSTQPDPAVKPADLDVLVRFPPGQSDRARCYLDLLDDLRAISGTPVDLIEIDAVQNSRLRSDFDRTRVVLLEVA